MKRRAVLGPVALALTLASPAVALTVDDVRCLCADDAQTRGDYVSCVAHLSRRLLAADTLDSRGRAMLIREAVRATFPPPVLAGCGRAEGGWGIGVQADRQGYHVGDAARVEGILWNLSPDDVTGESSGFGGADGPDECVLELTVHDASGALVHFASGPSACPDAVGAYPMEAGRVRRVAVDVPLVHRASQLGVPDGTPLAPGVYVARVEAAPGYPNRPGAFAAEWLPADAQVLIRVEP
jgi:hypothetical protein